VKDKRYEEVLLKAEIESPMAANIQNPIALRGGERILNGMKPRERIIAALEHQEPDRVPLDLGGINTSLMVETFKNFLNYIGMPCRDFKLRSKIWQTVQIPEPILEHFSIDTPYIFPEVVLEDAWDSGEEEDGTGNTGNKEDVFVDE
jgi:hypothetical protein